MSIRFEKTDEKIPLIEEPAKEIAEYVLKSDIELFHVFANTLLDCHTYKANTFVNDKIVKKIDLQKILYPQIADELEHLKNLLWEYFICIDDFKLDSLLKTNSSYYKNVSTEQKKLNKIRGVLFEIFVETIIRSRYFKGIFETGCIVVLNGKKVISYYNGKARTTIDIAAYQEERGEFYECKLSPNSLNEESYQYLDLLEKKCSRINGFDYLVGCITLGERLSLENMRVQIEENLKLCNENIMLFGGDELLQLKETPFMEAI